eukprot:scaffold11687_cov46-Prasinocladus_malaysianus.AAC.1
MYIKQEAVPCRAYASQAICRLPRKQQTDMSFHKHPWLFASPPTAARPAGDSHATPAAISTFLNPLGPSEIWSLNPPEADEDAASELAKQKLLAYLLTCIPNSLWAVLPASLHYVL